jgi:hypothetical protein
MIEVQILIAAILAGALFVLVRISWTLKGILDVLSAQKDTRAGPNVPVQKMSAESLSAETPPAEDTLQDIAAVIAVSERTIRQTESKPKKS